MTRFYIIFFLLVVSTNIQAETNRIKELYLDPTSVVTLYVAYNKSPLTVMFPSRITSIAMMNVKLLKKGGKTQYQQGFLLDFKPGSFYFTIYPVKKKARGSLNVVYERKVYTFDLVESDTIYYSSVTMKPMSEGVFSSQSGSSVTYTDIPTIIGLIEQSKYYNILKMRNMATIDIDAYVPTKDIVTQYEKFDVIIKEVFCYKHRDVIVFHTIFKNRSNTPIIFDPKLIRVATGTKSIPVTVIKSAGIIPPYASIVQWFAVANTRHFTGGKVLSAKNNWTILVITDDMKNQIVNNTSSMTEQLKNTSDELLSDALANENPKKLKQILREIERLKKTISYKQKQQKEVRK